MEQLAASEDELVRAIESAHGVERVALAVHLGDADGPAGPAVLRRLLRETGPYARQVRCAALLALAKRCGDAASPDLLEAVRGRDGPVRDYGVLGLAGAGDASGWDDVLRWLVALLLRPRRSRQAPPQAAVALSYLGRHARTPAQVAEVVGVLRARFDRLDDDERAWIEAFWPDAAPDGPAPLEVPSPDPGRLLRWVRQSFVHA